MVERSGSKPGWLGPVETLLLKDVVDAVSLDLLADHLWITAGVWSRGLAAGDVIELDGRSTAYGKGYRGRRDDLEAPPPSTDWRLSRPSKVLRLGTLAEVGHEVLRPLRQAAATGPSKAEREAARDAAYRTEADRLLRALGPNATAALKVDLDGRPMR